MRISISEFRRTIFWFSDAHWTLGNLWGHGNGSPWKKKPGHSTTMNGKEKHKVYKYIYIYIHVHVTCV